MARYRSKKGYSVSQEGIADTIRDKAKSGYSTAKEKLGNAVEKIKDKVLGIRIKTEAEKAILEEMAKAVDANGPDGYSTAVVTFHISNGVSDAVYKTKGSEDTEFSNAAKGMVKKLGKKLHSEMTDNWDFFVLKVSAGGKANIKFYADKPNEDASQEGYDYNW